jgi:polysaccharide export outer membrane protein
MKHSILALAGLLAIAAAQAMGQAAPEQDVCAAPAISTPGLTARAPQYRMRRGDSFDLAFRYSPELNQTVVVQPDGYVTLKEVGSVYIEGQTLTGVECSVKVAYAKILHDPVITVAPKDLEKPYFIAAGQVGKPGKYDLRSDLTLTEAVAVAGGFNERSKHSQVVLYRPLATGGYSAKLINVKQLLASRNLSEDMQILPGDMLYVPQNTFSKIRQFIPTPTLGAFY